MRGALALVDLVVEVDAPDPVTADRNVLQTPFHLRPSSRSIGGPGIMGNSYDLAEKIVLLLNAKGKSQAMCAESARISEYDVSIAKKDSSCF